MDTSILETSTVITTTEGALTTYDFQQATVVIIFLSNFTTKHIVSMLIFI